VIRARCRSSRQTTAPRLKTVRQRRGRAPDAPFRRAGAAVPAHRRRDAPGPAAQSDEEILAALDRDGCAGMHTVGSCRMGRDPQSVVDPAVRCARQSSDFGWMDASILPGVPAGNTNGPVIALAWRAADIIGAARVPVRRRQCRNIVYLSLTICLQSFVRHQGVNGHRGTDYGDQHQIGGVHARTLSGQRRVRDADALYQLGVAYSTGIDGSTLISSKRTNGSTSRP
jgi:hypothetical protein